MRDRVGRPLARIASGGFAAWLICSAVLAQPSHMPAPTGPMVTPPPQGLREHSTEWQAEKCRRYARMTAEAFTRFKPDALSPEFRARHEAFIAEGCTGKADVCPRSRQELDIANILVIGAMNAGMSGTFAPFGCPK
jgi:hypothetical protein